MIKTSAFFLLVFMLISSDSCFAFFQEDEGLLMQKAIKEYNSLRYVSAIKALDRVLKDDPSNTRAQDMIASSYRNTKMYDEALIWYGKLTSQKNIKPDWALYYAEALANKERYEESEKWYRKYLELKPGDRRAEAFSKAKIETFTDKKNVWDIALLNINTDASEYSPMLYKNGLLFISNRSEKSRYIFGWDQTPYTDMFVVDDIEDVQESDQSSIERKLEGEKDARKTQNSLFGGRKTEGPVEIVRPLRSKVKSSYHEGPAVRLADGSLIFTRNNFINKKAGSSSAGITKLKLYTAVGDNWENIIDFPFNSDEYSTGHPAISADGKVLIFASDTPRGFGGTDLYYCVRASEQGEWGRPVNLGPRINTEGDEQFPYLDQDGKLYFSSTGNPGLGGLDIFEVVLKDLKPVGKPRNLGAGINSPADDFGIIKDRNAETGYFSSNRRGNDDIYRFTKLAFDVKVKGLLLDAKTNRPISGAKILVKHNGQTDTLQINPFGEFNLQLSKSNDYEFSARALGYVSKQHFASTKGLTQDSTVNLMLRLEKADNVQNWVVQNCDSLKAMFAFENVYFDLDNSELRKEYLSSLDHIAAVMASNPSVQIITSSHCDSRASESYNRELSFRRGEAVKNYLMIKGISPNRIEVQYYGESRLINPCIEGMNCSEAEQALNRRTEFEVVMNGVNLSQVDCN